MGSSSPPRTSLRRLEPPYARRVDVLAARLVAIYKGSNPTTSRCSWRPTASTTSPLRTAYMEALNAQDERDRRAQVDLARAGERPHRSDLRDRGRRGRAAPPARVRARRDRRRPRRRRAPRGRGRRRPGGRRQPPSGICSTASPAGSLEIRQAGRRGDRRLDGSAEAYLGGPYSIPTCIVMCESGGNYRALNPSSGAGRRVPDHPLDLAHIRRQRASTRPRRPSRTASPPPSGPRSAPAPGPAPMDRYGSDLMVRRRPPCATSAMLG